NAAWLEEQGAAEVIADADLTGARFATAVRALLANEDNRAAMAARARALARPEAARDVARALYRVAHVEPPRAFLDPPGDAAGSRAVTARRPRRRWWAACSPRAMSIPPSSSAGV